MKDDALSLMFGAVKWIQHRYLYAYGRASKLPSPKRNMMVDGMPLPINEGLDLNTVEDPVVRERCKQAIASNIQSWEAWNEVYRIRDIYELMLQYLEVRYYGEDPPPPHAKIVEAFVKEQRKSLKDE